MDHEISKSSTQIMEASGSDPIFIQCIFSKRKQYSEMLPLALLYQIILITVYSPTVVYKGGGRGSVTQVPAILGCQPALHVCHVSLAGMKIIAPCWCIEVPAIIGEQLSICPLAPSLRNATGSHPLWMLMVLGSPQSSKASPAHLVVKCHFDKV